MYKCTLSRSKYVLVKRFRKKNTRRKTHFFLLKRKKRWIVVTVASDINVFSIQEVSTNIILLKLNNNECPHYYKKTFTVFCDVSL